MSQLHEECGVFGLYCPDPQFSAAACVYHGLYALQHRSYWTGGLCAAGPLEKPPLLPLQNACLWYMII